MSGVLVAVLAVAHLLVGAVYARSQAVQIYERSIAEWKYPDIAMTGVRFSLAWRVVFWPGAMLFDVVRPVISAWFTAPLDARRAKAAQLRKDADVWAEQACVEHDLDKRIMAEELARMLREQAREADL